MGLRGCCKIKSINVINEKIVIIIKEILYKSSVESQIDAMRMIIYYAISHIY